MAKIYGLFGAMSGKVADVVMSVRNGQQIVRKYQPTISNPKTQNQFSTRARFKLLSQLSAVLAPLVAFRRNGGVSPRNYFTRANFPITSFDLETSTAMLQMSSIDLTGGVVAFPGIQIERTANALNITIQGQFSFIDRVVFGVVQVQSDNDYRLIDTAVVEKNPDSPNSFSHSTRIVSSVQGYVFSYGMRDNTSTARTRFGSVHNADINAVLEVFRSLSSNDVTLTETSAVQFQSGTSLSLQNSDNNEENSSNSRKKTSKID